MLREYAIGMCYRSRCWIAIEQIAETDENYCSLQCVKWDSKLGLADCGLGTEVLLIHTMPVVHQDVYKVNAYCATRNYLYRMLARTMQEWEACWKG